MGSKVTIQDIARLAGVSKATVSRVLNHKPDVDRATRERVLRIMDEQGFVPSVAAAGLAGGRPRLVGVLVPSLTWPLMPEIMRGIGEVAEPSSYEIVLYSLSPDQDRSAIIDRILAAKLTSGLLAVFPGQSREHLSELYEQGFPVVMIDDQGAPEPVPWIGTDNRKGAYAAVKHLIELGHRRIAHVQGTAHYRVSRDRHEGYCDALREAGIAPDPTLLPRGDFKPPSGRVCGLELFQREDRPTAVFAANDEMAYGVLAAAEACALRVPADVAVVGFDDITSSQHMRPPLTTVRQPFYEMGQRGIELLLSLVNSPRGLVDPYHAGRREEPVRIYLPTELVVRESCGAHLLARQSVPMPSAS